MTSVPVLAATGFTPLDWGVVLAYFVFTTVLGARLAGRPSTIRDFFLGGRNLPWYAVAGSIIATEISAITFVAVPAMVFRPGGDFTYLQLGLFGALLARVVVGYVLVPAYYEREIYSPYDYMGNRLGGHVRAVTTALFSLGGILAQSARVYLTAVVLELILQDAVFAPLAAATGVSSLTWSIWTIGAVAVTWTLLGGITTVIWTDVILFLVFLIGGLTALFVIATRLDGGFAEIVEAGRAAGKFRLFDVDPDPTRAYTVWTAAIASTWGMTAVYGTDQLMAQRMFCCRGPREARRAILASYVGQGITLLVMVVGVGLFAWYQVHPLTGAAQALYEENPERIFPLFIIEVIPPGLTGLIIAGIFAAAISSLDSILAALGQTTLSAAYRPWRLRWLARRGRADDTAEERHQVRAGRVLVVGWGVVLCLAAQFAETLQREYRSLLDLALAMAGYTAGGLLAGFLLAFLPLRVDGYGYVFAAPFSVLFVLGTVWHEPWTQHVCLAAGAVLLCAWLAAGLTRRPRPRRFAAKTVVVVLAAALLVLVNRHGTFTRLDAAGLLVEVSLAWPWYAPVGCTVAFVLGLLLGNRKEA